MSSDDSTDALLQRLSLSSTGGKVRNFANTDSETGWQRSDRPSISCVDAELSTSSKGIPSAMPSVSGIEVKNSLDDERSERDIIGIGR